MCKSGFTLLVAMFALSVVGVSAASASLPEFSKSHGTLNGKLKSATFTQASGGVWSFPDSYSTSVFSSEITGAGTIGHASIVFQNAAWAVGPCFTGSTERGYEFVATGLKGRLGYINKAKKEVGLMLESPSKEPMAHCAYYGGEVAGDVIAKITPVYTLTKHFTLTFSSSGEGKQTPEFFEGEKESFPTSFPLTKGEDFKCSPFPPETCEFFRRTKYAIQTEVPLETAEEMEIKG